VNQTMIKINMQKAIAIKQNMIRAEREEKFKQLDVEFMRALESGDVNMQNEIIQKKQILRDATQHFSIVEASTPEELKAANPIAEINL
jgi:hypothetical protein